MAEINVYQQYFSAKAVFNGVQRRAASVLLIYDAPGRRARKRETQLLERLRDEADALASEAGGAIYRNDYYQQICLLFLY